MPLHHKLGWLEFELYYRSACYVKCLRQIKIALLVQKKLDQCDGIAKEDSVLVK